MKCGNGIEARQVNELFINIDPIQAGGRLTGDAIKAVIAYGDGYSVCDNCRKPNRLDCIAKPPIAEFHKDVAAWLNMDTARVMPGARRGFQAVAHTYVNKGDPVLLTSLSHYTEFLAVEGAQGVACEIPADNRAYRYTGGNSSKDRGDQEEIWKRSRSCPHRPRGLSIRESSRC